MKITKRLLSIALAAALILAGAGTGALAAEYDSANAVRLVFSDSGITVPAGAEGVEVEGTALKITAPGTYAVSGSCADGSITVKKGTTGVTLVLNGLKLSSSDTAPIACNKSTEVTIVAASGTVNDLADSAMNNDETYPDNLNAENAVIKCKDGSKVTICGGGTINVTARGKNGVKGGVTTEAEGEASLTVKDVTLNITAEVNDGLKSDQELNILSGNITVSAADDGIKSDFVLNIGAEGTDGPTVKVTKSSEGIEGAAVNIYSGDISVYADDDGINAANSDLTGYAYACNIYGGKVYVNVSAGDCIDSNGTLSIMGGTVELHAPTSGDGSPLDSDGTLTIGEGATVIAFGSGSMTQAPNKAEQPYVVFGGGFGGMGGFGGGRGGFGGQRPQDGQTRPQLPDGTQPQDGQQPPQLPEGTQPQDGQQPQQGGSNLSVKGGDTVTVTDESGKTLMTATAARDAAYVLFSSPELESGKTYTLNSGAAEAATATATTEGAAGAGMPGGGRPGAGTQPGTGAQPTYSDVQDTRWSKADIDFVTERGMMNGTGGGMFSPTVSTTRAMIVTILYRLEGSPAVTASGAFTDTADSWYTDAVSWAEQNGIVNGYGDGRFGPNDPITREQLAAILYRYAGFKGYALEAGAELSFEDAPAVSAYAADSMRWACGAGLINGSEGKLLPRGEATREQAAAIMHRFCDNIVK